MIDKVALKAAARQNLHGKKTNVFLVAGVYIVFFGVMNALIYALSGYDKLTAYLQNAVTVSPDLDVGSIANMVPPLTPAAAFFILSILLFKFIVRFGYKGYCLKLFRGEEPGFGTILDGFGLILKAGWLLILEILIVAGWSVLFLAPGVMAWYGYRQAFYLLLDNPELSAVECLRRSRRLMAGHKSELFLLDLSFLGWWFLDFIVMIQFTLRLLSIWLAPYQGVTFAGYYDTLLKTGSAV